MPEAPRRLARKVVLIGWDAADWKVITPLLDQGKLPHLSSLVQNGVMGNLATLQPVLSPMLWTSIATGRTADEHGILGFLEPDPVSDGVRPSTSLSRKTKAIWNILNQEGYRSHVVSWFASQPAEPINGVCVSAMFAHPPNEPAGKFWPVPPGSVHPPELQETLAELRLHPGELTAAEIRPFVPDFSRIDPKKEAKLVKLAGCLASAITTQGVATWILENEDWDFLAVFYDLIDHAGHDFMQFHPPRMEAVAEDQFETYREVMTNIYRYQDMMLGRVVELAGPEATIIIVSDHGFHSDELRPDPRINIGAETPALWHRRHGVICMSGPGLKKDELVHGAGLLDITPTILALYGLAQAEDMPGRVLSEALVQEPSHARIKSWEDVPGETGMHGLEDEDGDAWDSAAALEQLADLGYIEKPDENKELSRKAAKVHAMLNLGRVYLSTNRPKEAIPVLEDAMLEAPRVFLTKLLLAQAYIGAGRTQDCRSLIDAAIPEGSEGPVVRLLRANLELATGQLEKGLAVLQEAEEQGPKRGRYSHRIGRIYLRVRRWSDAERAFRTAIERDPDMMEAHSGLATALNAQQRYPEAAQAALDAIGLDFASPVGHYGLGVALCSMGEVGRAAQAFEVCLSLRPDAVMAHKWLAEIYQKALNDSVKAEQHSQKAKELLERTPMMKPAPDDSDGVPVTGGERPPIPEPRMQGS